MRQRKFPHPFNRLNTTFSTQTAPFLRLERGRCSSNRRVSWPACGGRRECRADHPRPNYAQVRNGRADRDPEARPGERIPTPAPLVDLRGDGRSAAAADARIAASAVRRVAAAPLEPRFPPCGRDRLKPVSASATCGAFRDDHRRVRRAAPESRFAQAMAAHRFAACAACARCAPALAE